MLFLRGLITIPSPVTRFRIFLNNVLKAASLVLCIRPCSCFPGPGGHVLQSRVNIVQDASYFKKTENKKGGLISETAFAIGEQVRGC